VRRLLLVLQAALLLAGLSFGCGGEKDKGINKDRDRPTPAERGR
jgi:hypothetical protein